MLHIIMCIPLQFGYITVSGQWNGICSIANADCYFV